jgi:dethiobiotin synthetase
VPDFLVTGTDTGVGKTVIAAGLITMLRAGGASAIGFKPAESGITAADPADSDILARASGTWPPLALPVARFTEPLSPAVAAERAGIAITPEEIEARIATLRAAGYTLVVEGAGGLLSPLAWTPSDPFYYSALDLAAHCRLEAIIVTRPGLGTLNHTAMTVALLRSRRIPVRALVLNGRRAPEDLAESTNPAALHRMLPTIPLVEVPHVEHGDVVDCIARTLQECAGHFS